MNVRAILATAVLATTTSAHAGTLAKVIPWKDPVIRCPLPTFDDCRTPGYYDTDCGIEKGVRCTAVLQGAFSDGYNATTTTKQIVEPTYMTTGGVRGPAALLPFDVNRMAHTDLNANALATYIGATMPLIVSLLRASSSPVLLTPDPTVTSCSDYVYKKYFDYSKFEDGARACGANLECVYNVARTNLGPPTLYSLVTATRPPTPIVPQIRSSMTIQPHFYQPRNGFFEIPPDQIFQFSKYSNDPSISAIRSAIASIPPTIDTGDRWAWHRDMHDRNAAEGLSDDDYLDAAARLDKYRLKEAMLKGLLHDLPLSQQPGLTDGCGQVLYIPGSDAFLPPSIGGGNSVGGGTANVPCTPPPPSTTLSTISALRDSMADDLLAEWHHVRNGVEDHGCLDASSARCDWSPRRFANEYLGRLQSQQEAAYSTCMNATANAMPSDPAKKADWVALEGYFAEAISQMADEAKALPWAPTSTGPSTNTLRIQGPKDHRQMGVPSVLSGEYDYDVWWELQARTALRGGVPKLCSVNSELAAVVNASFTAPQELERLDLETTPISPTAKHKIIEGSFDVYINRKSHLFGANTHLVLFDQLVAPDVVITVDLDGAEVLAAPSFQRTEKLFEYQEYADVIGIPVYVYIHVDGTAGYQYIVQTIPPPKDQCAGTGVIDEHNLAGAFTATLTPHADVHATASAGVGIRGILSVGAQADLDVVTANLPIQQTLAVVQDPGNPYNPAVQIGFDAHLDGNLMAGSISVYAEALWKRVDKEIVHWAGVHLDETVSQTFTIPLRVFNTQFH